MDNTELTNTEAMTLQRLHEWDSPIPPYTRWAVFKDLVERGLVDIRITAKGLMALDAYRDVYREHDAPMPYSAQVRDVRVGESGWTTLSRGRTEYEAADQLWSRLQKEGFRTGELPDHMDDLARGHVISTDDGLEFRVLRATSVEIVG